MERIEVATGRGTFGVELASNRGEDATFAVVDADGNLASWIVRKADRQGYRFYACKGKGQPFRLIGINADFREPSHVRHAVTVATS